MSITKRGPGQWLVRLRRKGHSFAQTYSTYEEAEREEARVKAEMTGGRYADRRQEQDTPLSVLLERYLEEETPKKKGSKQETNVVKAWLRSDLAKLPVASITPLHIARWRNERVRAGKAPSTISNPMNSLSAVFKVAITRLRYVHLDALDLSKTTGHKTLTVLARYDNEKPENRAAAIRERERALMAKRASRDY